MDESRCAGQDTFLNYYCSMDMSDRIADRASIGAHEVLTLFKPLTSCVRSVLRLYLNNSKRHLKQFIQTYHSTEGKKQDAVDWSSSDCIL
jgi:hypothetical protein